MKPFFLLLLICMISIAAVPAMAVSAENYMGGDVQIGGSGPNTIRVTEITTAITQAAAGTAATGSLTVTTDPMGATILIDGLQRGVSPHTITGLTPGEHTILLQLSGYTDLTAQVTISAGQMTVYTTDLSRPASTPLPALPAATKSPGFEAILGIAVLGTVLAVRGYSR